MTLSEKLQKDKRYAKERINELFIKNEALSENVEFLLKRLSKLEIIITELINLKPLITAKPDNLLSDDELINIIIETICEFTKIYNITTEKSTGFRASGHLAETRQFINYFIRLYTTKNNNDVAKILGIHHSSVIINSSSLQDKIETEEITKNKIIKLKYLIDEKIKNYGIN